jgi:hypothetical protein
MAGEQTVTIAQTTNTTVKVVVNAIGSSGSHVPLVIDTTTTRLDGRSEVPTVYYPTGSTGIAEIRFSVTSSSLTEFTTLICKVNGTADSVAFSEYAIPIKVLASEAASSAQIATDVWSETESTYTLPIYSGTLGARLAAAFDPAVDTVDVGKIKGDATSADNLQKSSSQMAQGTVSTGNVTPSTTTFAASDITEATSGHYTGRIIIFTSGNLQGQATDITGYSFSSSEGVFTVSQMTEAPSSSDTFIIV